MILFHDVVEVFDLSDINLKEHPSHHEQQNQMQFDSINASLVGTGYHLINIRMIPRLKCFHLKLSIAKLQKIAKI